MQVLRLFSGTCRVWHLVSGSIADLPVSLTQHRACRATRRAKAALDRIEYFMLPISLVQLLLQNILRGSFAKSTTADEGTALQECPAYMIYRSQADHIHMLSVRK